MTMAQLDSRSAEADLMKAVFDPVRLHVLERLDRQQRPIDVETLAESLATEFAATVPSERDYEKFQIALVHAHLPALAEVSLVRYDTDSGTVDVGDAFAPVTQLRDAWNEFLDDVERAGGTT